MAEIDPVIAQLLQLTQQQTAPVPTLNTGLLAPGQQQLTDVFTDPDQAQVNALIGAVSGALNPRGGQPGLTALANAAQQFGGTRQTEFQNRLAQRKLQSQELRNKIQDTLGIANLGQKIREVDVFEGRLAEQKREFGIKESRLTRGQEFEQQFKALGLETEIAKAGDIFEDVIGRDEFGGQIKAKFRRNPITGETVQLSGGVTSTTPARRAGVNELTSKAQRAVREGSDIFFDEDLDTIFGPLELRPLIGGLTEGAIAGKSRELQSKFDRFVTERVLDVARVLAPVTDVDVNLLTKQLAPGKTLGSAQEARNWYVGQFMPKILSDLRFNGAATKAIPILENAIGSKGITDDEALSLLGTAPTVEEVRGFTKGKIFTPSNNQSILSGKALTEKMISNLAKINGVTPDEYIAAAGLVEVP